MPPTRKPTSSHSSRLARPSGGSFHRPPSPPHRPDDHRPDYHRPSPGGGFLTGMIVGGLLRKEQQQQQMNQTTVSPVQQTQQPKPAGPQKYHCPYCDGKVIGKPAGEGVLTLSCPQCGGILEESDAIKETSPSPPPQPQPERRAPVQDYDYSVLREPVHYGAAPSFGSRIKSCLGTLFGLVVVCGIAIGGFFFFSRNDSERQPDQGYYQEEHHSPKHDESIYVSVLDREAHWSNQFEAYYDRETDCYFFLNDEMDPPIWQYWFEGVSNKYGSEFGWLEWDEKKHCWYVQTGKNTWKPLPEDQITDRMWHMN